MSQDDGISITMPDDEEIAFGDTEDDELATTEVPKKVRVLQTQAYDKSVSDLVSMIGNRDISLDPDYQRNYIWDNKKASLLVESILLSVPIPVIYVAEEADSRWSVIDGLQRLNALRRFCDNEFRLTGLEVLAELNGVQCSRLNPKASRILRNGILRIIVVLQESDPEIKYDIFLRLNRGSIKLNEQELRNCLYRGRFNDLLKTLRTHPNFLKCLKMSAPSRRFIDAELALRHLAISENHDRDTGKVRHYRNKMKTFLNTYMASKSNVSDEELAALSKKFISTVDKVYRIFGSSAFVRVDPLHGADVRVNRALMDVVMLGVERLSDEQVIDLKDQIVHLHSTLPSEDRVFDDALTYGTNDTRKLEYRIAAWLNAIDQIAET